LKTTALALATAVCEITVLAPAARNNGNSSLQIKVLETAQATSKFEVIILEPWLLQ